MKENKKSDTTTPSLKVAPQELKPSTPSQTTKETKQEEPNNSSYTYCYTLVTPEQKKVIDLTSSKAKIEKLFKDYFKERLISIIVEKHNYTLELKDSYEVGEKRMLGKSIGAIDNLKSHAKKVYYNNNQDFSTQLFKLKKVK